MFDWQIKGLLNRNFDGWLINEGRLPKRWGTPFFEILKKKKVGLCKAFPWQVINALSCHETQTQPKIHQLSSRILRGFH